MSNLPPVIEHVDPNLAAQAPVTFFSSQVSVIVADQGMAAHIAALLAIPGNVFFAANTDSRVRIREPFAVRLEKCNEGIAAVIDEINEFGLGATPSDALHDLGKTLVELYISLRFARDLSPDLVCVREFLKRHIEGPFSSDEGARVHDDRK